jgi:hypothetical protein
VKMTSQTSPAPSAIPSIVLTPPLCAVLAHPAHRKRNERKMNESG